jgi:heat shock protein 1/8
MNSEIIIGIDLGTTFSAVSYWNKDHCEIIPNKDGKNTTPSWISFTNKEVLIGERARLNANVNQKNTLFSVKRVIGKRFADEQLQEDINDFPYTIIQDINGMATISVNYKNEQHVMRPEQISAYLLTYLKECAEEKLGVPINKAVITVPAYFNNSQRNATKQACILSGMECVRIVNEPTAACLCYGLGLAKSNAQKVLVFDLGGGTFDVSILSITESGIFEVLATNGDPHLGGEDFDNEIVKHIIADLHIRLKSELKSELSDKNKRKIKNLAEMAKCSLSTSSETLIDFEINSFEYSKMLSRSKFEELCAPLFEKCMAPVRAAILDAHNCCINEIILVGGSTRIPYIRQMLQKEFAGKKLNMSVHPDEAVALGAGIQAAILSGNDESGKTNELLLLDVVPLSLGVESQGGIFSKVIERNTQIPVSRTKMYSTSADRQSYVDIKIFEGERDFTINNHKIADFRLSGIPKQARGVPKIEVSFNVDANGILSVKAIEQESGCTAEVAMIDSIKLSDAEIKRMIDDSQAHKIDDVLKREALSSKFAYEKYLNDLQRAINDPELMQNEDITEIIDAEIIDINSAILSNLEWLCNDDLSKELIDETRSIFEHGAKVIINKIYQRKKQLELKMSFIKDENININDMLLNLE